MAIAGPVPIVNGNFTQTRFNSARPRSNSLPILSGESSPASAPVNAAEIHAMQLRGRKWSLPLLPPVTQAEIAAMPGQDAISTANRQPFEDMAVTVLRRSVNEGDGTPPAADIHLRSLLESCADLSREIEGEIKAKAEPRQKYTGALSAVEALRDAIIRQQLHIPQTGPASRVEVEGGLLVLDVDEAAHGMYAAIKNTFSNGFGSLGEALARDAKLWAHDPKAWLTQSALPHSGADVAVAGIVTTALVPFALLALHAGITEMRESRQQGEALELEVAQSLEFLATLNRLSTSIDAATPPQFRHLIKSTKKVRTQQLKDLQHLQQKVRQNGQIGVCSTISGGSIVAGTTFGAATKITNFVVTGGTAATAMATSAGIASTMIFGPIASCAAFGLGYHMANKSVAAKKEIAPVAEQLKNRLADAALDPLRRKTAGKHDYLGFLRKKVDQRLSFLDDYTQKNKGFLFGSGLYATGAFASFGLTVAALLGAGVMLGPIGMGVLLAAGTVGGLIMGRYSTQFLFGHGRMHRYENYSVGDDPELDRHFLGTIETFTEKNPQIAKTAGIAMRAAYYKQAATRDELYQDFVGDVARSLGKRFHQAQSYSTDSDDVRAKRGGTKGKWDIFRATVQKKYEGLAGYFRAGMNYLWNLLHLRGHAAAKASAAALRQDSKPYLSVNDLQHWLHDPANHAKQIALMHDSLEAQIEFLREKTTLRVEMYMHSNNIDTVQSRRPDGTLAPAASTASVANPGHDAARNALLAELAAPLARDVDMRDQAENLRAELAQYHPLAPNGITREVLAKITSRFLSLQCGLPYDPKQEIHDIRQSQASLAYYYLKEAPGRYRNLRGLLVDTELQATRLAMKGTERISPQSAAGTSRRSR